MSSENATLADPPFETQTRLTQIAQAVLEATPDTVPPFAHRLVLIDRGARGGVLRAFGSFELDGRRETVNGVAVRFAHRPYLAARLRRDSDRFDARLTVGQVRDIREARP